MNKKALVVFANSDCCPHFETGLEIMKNLASSKYEVYSLFCGKVLNGFCTGSNFSVQVHSADGVELCNSCSHTYKRGMNLLKINKKYRLRLENIPEIESLVFNFSNADELKNYHFEDINVGLGVYSFIISHFRDYKFDLDKNFELIEQCLKSACIVYKNISNLIEKYNFDEIYLFNGRFIESYPIVDFCKKHNIDYYLHERGSNCQKYDLRKNSSFHRIADFKYEINKYWQNSADDKKEIARKWFTERKNGQEQCWISFTKEQKRDALPKDFENFNKAKENIAIFNSSLDEYYAFDDWKNPLAESENIILFEMIKKYKNDRTKHFYLRIHPNLTNVNSTQMQEIKEFAAENYSNLTIIFPEDEIDSYALLNACDKILVFCSTMGVEACYWGKPAILAGRAPYEDLDCCYIANNFDELYTLLETNLPPKNKENAYPFAYRAATYGIEFRYFQPNGLFGGTFMGKNLRAEPFSKKIKAHLLAKYLICKNFAQALLVFYKKLCRIIMVLYP